MKWIVFLVLFSGLAGALEWHFKFFTQFNKWNYQAHLAEEYEKKSLYLTLENRNLKNSIQSLKYQLRDLEAKNNYLEIKLNEKNPTRTIASVSSVKTQNDLVSFEVYQWSSDKLLAIGLKELHLKNYEKAAQFFNELIVRYPNDKKIDDKVLFQAGVAAYESKKHYDWASMYLQQLVKQYPKSSYYRGAKLWLGLSNLNQGNKKAFFETVEEFRLYYRNTEEWKILSKYYEEFAYRYQK